MTPEERNLVIELFDRLGTLEDVQRDPEAERLIRDGLRQAPNALYALVQTVLVQDEALKRANARIQELEAGASANAAPRDSSFLGGMRDSLLGRRESRGSVPSVRSNDPAHGPSQDQSQGMSSAWRTGAPTSGPSPGYAPAPGYGQAPGYAPPAAGGSFLGTAAAAAAGVIGGSLLMSGIRNLMGGPGSAHAAFDPSAGGSSSPWGVGAGSAGGGELSHQAGLDDIGRSSAGASGGGAGRGVGLFDGSGGDDVADGQADEDFDDGGFDVGGDGGSDD